MSNLLSIIQIVLAFGLINVWLIRFKKSTKYRGGNSQNMKQEFHTYGLSERTMYVIGFLKLCIASSMILGFWLSDVIFPAAILLVGLMLGAIYMHFKVRDSFSKFLPAICMCILSLLAVFLTR